MSILDISGSQTMGLDPLVGRGRNFSGSRKSFKIYDYCMLCLK